MAGDNGNAKYNRGARFLFDSIELFFGRLHRRQRYTPHVTPVKVNLGSGLRVAPGWINVDGSLKIVAAGWPDFLVRQVYKFISDENATSPEQFVGVLANNTFVHHNLKYGIPLPDSSADFIFTSHTLHHLYRDEAAVLLKDAFRVLKPGGTLRIAVPDLEYIMSLYQRGERERVLGYFFYLSDPRNQYSRRHYQYDFELLRQLLAGVGYREIRRCEFQQGRTPDLEVLDNRPDETLFVEADKSA
jgi:SAM-dependent methyltransferase